MDHMRVRVLPGVPNYKKGTEKMNEYDIDEAALDLKRHLFEHFPGAGFIGVGTNTIYVYIRADVWRGETLDTWKSFPVAWRFGVGTIKAEPAR